MAETKASNVYQRLLEVQSSLTAPRSVDGKFGKARSAELILEAVKPLCKVHGLALVVSETNELLGDRLHVVSTATVTNVDTPTEQVSATASAWENAVEVNKYGQAILDTSQVTGKTSSYAKKYALQNLFAIDDTKDADVSHEPGVPQDASSSPMSASSEPVEDVLARAKAKINETLEQQGYVTVPGKKAFILKVLKKSSIESLDDADAVMDQLENEKGGES